MAPVVIYESKAKLWKTTALLALLLAILIGLEYWLASSNHMSTKVLILKWAFIVITPFFLVKSLLPAKAVLKLTPDGIEFNPLIGRRTYKWSEVADFGIRQANSTREFFVASSAGQREIVIQENFLPGTLEELHEVFKTYRESQVSAATQA